MPRTIFKPRHLSYAAAFVGITLLVGCQMTKSVQTYSGPARSSEEQALLHTKNEPGQRLYIMKVDEKLVTTLVDQINGVETHEVSLLPGSHRVVFEVRGVQNRGAGEVVFITQAGATYIGKSLIHDDKFTVWIEDTRTGEVVGKLENDNLEVK